MSLSPIFMFAPVPLTGERSPLAHAAELSRRRMAEAQALAAASGQRAKPEATVKVVNKSTFESAAA